MWSIKFRKKDDSTGRITNNVLLKHILELKDGLKELADIFKETADSLKRVEDSFNEPDEEIENKK